MVNPPVIPSTSNNTPIDVLLCMGTRPEIIKMMPVYRALKKYGLRTAVIHTGQHEEMATSLYRLFEMDTLPLTVLRRDGSSLHQLTSGLCSSIGRTLEQLRPLAMLVHGDTTSALTGALCGFYEQIPIGHVEAGLRTGEWYNPFPEEKNRELIARLAHWHFCPTTQAAQHLYNEGITNQVLVTGNTAIDAALITSNRLNQTPTIPHELLQSPGGPMLEQLYSNATQAGDQHLIVVTAHRRENWGDGLMNIARAMLRWLRLDPLAQVIWPVHPNPHVANTIRRVLDQDGDATLKSRLHLTGPLSYESMIYLLNRAWIIATDSGGLQEEASAFRKRILVLRDSTERPEILDCGLGQLVGTHPDSIVGALRQARQDDDNPCKRLMNQRITSPFGDGRAADRIAQRLISALNLHHLSQVG